MSSSDRQRELFDHVLRLRAIGRRLPGDGDLAAVRAAIERELGPTVSQRAAARLLGVTHTALQRWIRAGDLAVVPTPAGRPAVPVAALVELREALDAAPDAAGSRYKLTPHMRRNRRAAERLRVPEEEPRRGGGEHDRARRRALAYHRAVARRLRRSMVDEARNVLVRWRAEERIDPRHGDRWEALLQRPVREIRQAIVAATPEGDDLRQTSPFAGMLSEPERRRVLEQVR